MAGALPAYPAGDSRAGGPDAAAGPRGPTRRRGAALDTPQVGGPDAAAFANMLLAALGGAPDASPLPSDRVRAEVDDPGRSGDADPDPVGADDPAAAGTSSAVPGAPMAVAVPDRSWAGLAPELRARLERVVDRMWTEHGHRVELVEGYRTPERQAALYAQGRTAPGPIVTWTRASRHSQGRAADLLVDGSFDAHGGYARLQAIAREERLGVLGMRDPGHVELPEGVGGSRPPGPGVGDARVPAAGAARTEAPGQDPLARFRVAEVAKPPTPSAASVARVATPARPGPTRALAAGGAPSSGATPDGSEGGSAADLAALAGEARVRRLEIEGDVGRATENGIPTSGVPPEGSGAGASAFVTAAREPARGNPVHAVDAAVRVEQVRQILEARGIAAPAAPGLVSVRLDGAGGPDHVRIGLARRRLEVELDVADSTRAHAMRAHGDELATALGRRGLELGALRITSADVPTGRESLAGADGEGMADTLSTLLGRASNGANADGRAREERHPEGHSHHSRASDRDGSDRPGEDRTREERDAPDR